MMKINNNSNNDNNNDNNNTNKKIRKKSFWLFLSHKSASESQRLEGTMNITVMAAALALVL